MSKTETMDKIQFQVLMKFIKPFDGDREKLSSFIKNCDNAIKLTSEPQTDLLFKYILSQLEGKAELACSLKIFDSWQELKPFLKSTFGETKHRDHLLLELQNCKIKASESITEFSLRLETCLTRLQTDIVHASHSPDELKGRIASTEDLALHTFLLGLPSNISTIVRCRNPSNLKDAMDLATQEEKLHNYMQFRTTDPKSIKCRSCGKPGHSERNCYTNRRPVHNISQTQPSPNAPQVIICRYCKHVGHDITNCRKRQFNNSRQPNSSQSFNKVHNYNEYYDNSSRSDEHLN